MKNLLDKMFKLPPVDERKMVDGWFKSIFYPDFHKEHDDTYIYYQYQITNLLISFVLVLLFWASFKTGRSINLYFFIIDMPRVGFIQYSAKTFSFWCSIILWAVAFPIYLIKFIYNIDFRKKDLSVWAEKHRQRRKILTHRKGIVLIRSVAFLFCAILPFKSYYFFDHFILKKIPSLENSEIYLFISLLFAGCFISAMIMSAMTCLTIIFQQIFFVKNKNGRL